jgi:hypothetical protein
MLKLILYKKTIEQMVFSPKRLPKKKLKGLDLKAVGVRVNSRPFLPVFFSSSSFQLDYIM